MNIPCKMCNTNNNNKIIKKTKGYSLYKCSNCQLVYAYPPVLNLNIYQDAYTEAGEYAIYLKERENIITNNYHLTWAMRNFFRKVQKPGKLLDIGCSTGGFLKSAKDRGWEINGLELSIKAAEIAGEINNIKIFNAPIEKIKGKEKYDVITAWEVLEHIEEPISFLQLCYSLLKPGGILALSTPNWGSPWVIQSGLNQHWPPYHLTFWDKRSLSFGLFQVKFKIINIREKPFAWHEEVGLKKYAYLPIALIRSFLFNQKGMHLFALSEKK